jgi:cytochrome c peroxidase
MAVQIPHGMRRLMRLSKRFALVAPFTVAALLLGPSATWTQESSDLGSLPKMPIPADNQQTDAKVELGTMLYFDPRLSKGNTISCASCHNPETGWADARQFSIGAGGKQGGRQAPTVLNIGYQPFQFWDGRAESLEEQVLGSIQNPIEMAETLPNVVKKLRAVPEYKKRFKEVFGTEVSAEGIARAIAAFERTVVSANSAYDKYLTGDKAALSDAAVRGLDLFTGKGGCEGCHNGPNFTDNRFRNIGVPQVGPLKEDVGRYAVTKQDLDRMAFKNPTLRSVALTAPYMHDGAYKTLEDVIEFYDKGGEEVPGKDRAMVPLNLTDQEKKDLVEFLKALTGESLKIGVPKLP